MMFQVRVPATTANLGPGFDCLGMALDLWNETEFHLAGDHLVIQIEGEGAGGLPVDENNAIYSAMHSFALAHQKTLPTGLRIFCRNRIPLGSGLGSSAAAAVTGIIAAGHLLGIPYNLVDLLVGAAQIEGHPDNAAPCLMGGLVASIIDQGRIIARSLPVAPLFLCITLPQFDLPTRQARAALPAQVPHPDAVYNLSRAVMTIEALRSGDLDLLGAAMQDKLHQPYRIGLIPGAENAFKAARSAGAAAVVLSGAGPSILAVARTEENIPFIRTAMEEAFHQAGLAARSFTPRISDRGAEIIEADRLPNRTGSH
jgi:homoserine kinase